MSLECAHCPNPTLWKDVMGVLFKEYGGKKRDTKCWEFWGSSKRQARKCLSIIYIFCVDHFNTNKIFSITFHR